MRRVSGFVLTLLGAFFLLAALLLRFWIAPSAVKFPLDEYQVVTLTGTGSYFSAAQGKELNDVSVQITYTTRGDVAAGSSSVAVWDQFVSVRDVTNRAPISYDSIRQAFSHQSPRFWATTATTSPVWIGVRGGQRRRWNSRRAVFVIQGPGMGQTMVIGAERAQQIGDGAPLCGFGRTATPNLVGGAVAAAVLRPHHALGHDGDLAVERSRSGRQQIFVGPEQRYLCLNPVSIRRDRAAQCGHSEMLWH